MLVVVHDGDRELSLESTLDLEAFGRLDVLEVDGSEGRGDSLDRADEGLGVVLIDLYVEGIDTRIDLEE